MITFEKLPVILASSVKLGIPPKVNCENTPTLNGTPLRARNSISLPKSPRTHRELRCCSIHLLLTSIRWRHSMCSNITKVPDLSQTTSITQARDPSPVQSKRHNRTLNTLAKVHKLSPLPQSNVPQSSSLSANQIQPPAVSSPIKTQPS